MYTKITYLNDLITIKSLSEIKKTADASDYVGQLASYIKNLFGNQFPNGVDAQSFLKFLSPAIIFQIFKSLGFKWIAGLAGLLASVFGVDLSQIITTIISGIKSLVSSGEKLSSEQVNSVVESAIPQTLKTARINYDKIVKLAYKEDYTGVLAAIKQLGEKHVSVGTKIFGLLRSVLSWTFVTMLWAGGFLIAGDVVSSFLGKFIKMDKSSLNPFTSNPSSNNSSQSTYVEKHSDGWTENIVNNKTNIINLILDYVEEYYPKADESKIIKSPVFIGIVRHILLANSGTVGYKFVMIPNNFSSKKEIADKIMDSLK
jgi:hypothetical protein